MRTLFDSTKTAIILRVGVVLFIAGAVFVATPVALERARPVPELNAKEQELFMMLDLEPRLAVKYKKYGDIVIREQAEPIPRGVSVLTTYFYKANAIGDLWPIGDRREQVSDSGQRFWGWRTINGKGERSQLWKRYTDTISYSDGNSFSGHEDDIKWGAISNTGLHVSKNHSVDIRFRSGEIDLSDSNEVARIAFAGAAVQNADAIDRGVAKQVKAALAADRKAQGRVCSDIIYIVTRDSMTDGAYDFTSVLGGASAINQYGIMGVRGLHRFHVQNGVVDLVDEESKGSDGYDIDDVRSCRVSP